VWLVLGLLCIVVARPHSDQVMSRSGNITDYFQSSSSLATKRTHPSTSSESDTSFSSSEKQQSKRANMDSDALQASFKELMQRMDCLATKDDVREVKSQMKELTDGVTRRMEVLEAQFLEMECKANKTDKDLKVLQGKTTRQQNNLNEHEIRIQALEREQNDLQQYSRRWNLRVYKVPEASGETTESCRSKVSQICTDLVGVTITLQDIEVAHRSGKPGSRPRPILVKFFDRKKRDEVLANRRKLKNKGYAIDEDLTVANYKLSKKAAEHSASMAVWSASGKILAKLKNGRIIKLTIHTNIDELFQKMMNGNTGGGGEGDE